jgi:hypothetical protein
VAHLEDAVAEQFDPVDEGYPDVSSIGPSAAANSAGTRSLHALVAADPALRDLELRGAYFDRLPGRRTTILSLVAVVSAALILSTAVAVVLLLVNGLFVALAVRSIGHRDLPEARQLFTVVRVSSIVLLVLCGLTVLTGGS